MKAVIVEVRGGYAAAMTEDGRFVRLKNNRYGVGQTVSLRAAKRTGLAGRILLWASSAAAFLIVLAGGFFALYETPYGLVSLDVNPSIEYTINRFDIVLRAEGVNEDGAAILAMIGEDALIHRTVDEAVSVTIDQLRAAEYFSGDAENYVILATVARNESHAETLAVSLCSDLAAQKDLTVESAAVTQAQADEARKLGTTPGKLYIVDRLGDAMGGGNSFEASDWLDKPVREIMESFHELGGNAGNGNGASSGNGPSSETALSSNAPEDGQTNNGTDPQRTPAAQSGGQKKPQQTPAPFFDAQATPDPMASPSPEMTLSPSPDGTPPSKQRPKNGSPKN